MPQLQAFTQSALLPGSLFLRVLRTKLNVMRSPVFFSGWLARASGRPPHWVIFLSRRISPLKKRLQSLGFTNDFTSPQSDSNKQTRGSVSFQIHSALQDLSRAYRLEKWKDDMPCQERAMFARRPEFPIRPFPHSKDLDVVSNSTARPHVAAQFLSPRLSSESINSTL
jgi:hypothetical protein